MFNITTGEVTAPTIKTSNYGGLSADDIAEICTNKIMSVSETAPPEIREQAKFFKNQLYETVKLHVLQAMESEREKCVQTCIKGGHDEVANILRRL